MGSHNKAAVAVATHEVKTTEVHGVGASPVCSETEAAALAALAKDYPMKIEPNVERWVIPGWVGTPANYGAVTADQIYYCPIFVEEDTTYIRIGCYIGQLSAGEADLRIYAWENGLPGVLILSAGTVDTGAPGAKEIIISQLLTRGYYFLAIRCTGTPSITGVSFAEFGSSPFASFMTSNINTDAYITMAVIAAYADPAPAPDIWLPFGVTIAALVRLREN